MDVVFVSIDGRSSLTIQVESADAFDADATVTVTHEGFVGRSARELTFRTTEMQRFVAELRAFSQRHVGEATLAGLEGYEPYGTRLRVFAPDRARHAALTVSLRREVPSGWGWYLAALELTFELDPSRWDELLAAWQQVLDAALAQRDPEPSP